MAPRRCAGYTGHRCTTWVTGKPRCALCTHVVEQGRGTRQARGYDAAHDRARRTLASTLPAPCGYCSKTIQPGDRWDAAHRVDGRPELGYIVAHPACNQRAKAR